MKYIVCFFLILFATDCYGYDYDDLSNEIGDSGYSPAVHWAIGGVTGGLVVAFIPDKWELNKFEKAACGVVASLVVGGVIESLDEDFDNRDFLDYGLGGVVGAALFTINF